MNKKRWTLNPQILQAILLLLLIGSWALLFLACQVINWSLAPYDTTPLELRPPEGTWAREMSDLFQSPSGSLLLPTLVVSFGLTLFLFGLTRAPLSSTAQIKLGLGFTLSNLVTSAAIFGSVFLMATLPLEITPYPGYGWTIKFLLPQLLLLILLFTWQIRRIPPPSPFTGRMHFVLGADHAPRA